MASEIVPDEDVESAPQTLSPPEHAHRPERACRATLSYWNAMPGEQADRQRRHADESEVQLASSAPRQRPAVVLPASPQARVEPDVGQLGAGRHRQVPPVAEQQRQPHDRPDAEVGVARHRPVATAAGRERDAARSRRGCASASSAPPPRPCRPRSRRCRRRRRAAEAGAQRQRQRARIEATRLDADVADHRVVIGRGGRLVGGRDRPDPAPGGGRRRGSAPAAAAGGGAAGAGTGGAARPRRRGRAGRRRRRGRGCAQARARSTATAAAASAAIVGARTGQVPLATRQMLAGARRRRRFARRSPRSRGCRRPPPGTHFS